MVGCSVVNVKQYNQKQLSTYNPVFEVKILNIHYPGSMFVMHLKQKDSTFTKDTEHDVFLQPNSKMQEFQLWFLVNKKGYLQSHPCGYDHNKHSSLSFDSQEIGR